MHAQTPRSKSKSEAPAPVLRAALYLRVSTGRQAEHDLSIPDQRAQTANWVAARGWTLAAEYVEPGASATDDKRPEFQRMIERACDGDNPFDVIIVHSYSRFFRDAFGLEFYVRKLAKHGVKLVSMTQELGDDPAQVMMRQVISLFDEYQSKENAKHVLRSMKENARQGFWNGSTAPFGYRTVEARGAAHGIKKRLEIDPVEAEQVQFIFKLVVGGHEGSSPMGTKAVATWLNARGYRTRKGGMWGNGTIHQLLTNPVYGGRWRFNHVDSKTRREKADAEQIFADAPAIIAPGGVRRCATAIEGPQSTHRRAAFGYWSDLADRTGILQLVPRRDVTADRHVENRQGASVLRLLDVRAKGQESVSWSHGADGSARQSRDQASDGQAADR